MWASWSVTKLASATFAALPALDAPDSARTAPRQCRGGGHVPRRKRVDAATAYQQVMLPRGFDTVDASPRMASQLSGRTY